MRRLVLRLIKPFTAHQQELDAAILETLQTLTRDTAATREALRADRLREAQSAAAQLAELRRQAARAEEQARELQRLSSDFTQSAREPVPGNGNPAGDQEMAHRAAGAG